MGKVLGLRKSIEKKIEHLMEKPRSKTRDADILLLELDWWGLKHHEENLGVESNSDEVSIIIRRK